MGIGAVAGATALPRLRGRVSPGALMSAGTLLFAAVTLALAYVDVSALAALALVLGGIAWILVLSTLVGASATDGPVLVTIEYRPMRGRERELVEALHAGRYARRCTGASSWRVWRDATDPGHVLEQFVVGSWDEHLRQHERVSLRDQQRLEEIKAMTDPDQPTVVRHWLAPRLDQNAPE